MAAGRGTRRPIIVNIHFPVAIQGVEAGIEKLQFSVRRMGATILDFARNISARSRGSIHISEYRCFPGVPRHPEQSIFGAIESLRFEFDHAF